MKGDISKLSASIGSCNILSMPCSVRDIEKPSVYNWEEVESVLKSFLNPEELEHIDDKILFAQVSRSSMLSKYFSSNLWLVSEPLAEKAIEINTYMYLQIEDNSLSRNYTPNDRMLQCKLLQSLFFTYSVFLLLSTTPLEAISAVNFL